jgi:uncharacterized protein (DUF4213/DUF364 family)
MKLISDLLESVRRQDCPVRRVCIGLHWTAVESRFVGMAHTYKTARKVEIARSGDLVGRSALELAGRLREWEPLEASLGLAALNSLVEPVGDALSVNDTILGAAAGKKVAVIGRFPFNGQLAEIAAKAYFFEMEPEKGELPPFATEEYFPEADVAVITATALINKSLPRLLELSKNAYTVVLGPSTPMSDVLFRYGADVAAGIRVVEPEALIDSLMQGAKAFRKIKGVEPVTRFAPR